MKLFVGGLPFDVDDQELHEIFSNQGTVTSAKVINDRETGKSRGYCELHRSSTTLRSATT